MARAAGSECAHVCQCLLENTFGHRPIRWDSFAGNPPHREIGVRDAALPEPASLVVQADLADHCQHAGHAYRVGVLDVRCADAQHRRARSGAAQFGRNRDGCAGLGAAVGGIWQDAARGGANPGQAGHCADALQQGRVFLYQRYGVTAQDCDAPNPARPCRQDLAHQRRCAPVGGLRQESADGKGWLRVLCMAKAR